MKHLFTAILFLALASAAFGQNFEDKVVVAGDPALTESILEKSRDLWEFSFGGPMSEQERSAYINELKRQWQDRDGNTIKAIQQMVEIHNKINGLGRDQLLKIQAQLREGLVKELREQAAKDALARILWNAYERIAGLNVKQGGGLPAPKQQQQVSQAAGSIPREILGEWVKSTNTSGGFTNGYSFSGPSGEKMILHFYADGTYKGGYFVQSSMSYGCTMKVFMPSNGVFKVENNTLHLKELKSHTSSYDTCVARYNYEKDNSPGTYAYPVRMERDQNGLKIVLTMQDGNHNFYFNNGKALLGN